MDIIQLLTQKSEEIVTEATNSLVRSHLEHYEADGTDKSQQRLRALYDLTVECLKDKNATPITKYAEDIATQRFQSGFELFEVQTAFNVLEEAIWKQILTQLEPSEFAQAIGLIGTILGIGKDTLARTYVTLASKSKSPSLDLRALFAGTDGV